MYVNTLNVLCIRKVTNYFWMKAKKIVSLAEQKIFVNQTPVVSV